MIAWEVRTLGRSWPTPEKEFDLDIAGVITGVTSGVGRGVYRSIGCSMIKLKVLVAASQVALT